MPQTLSVEEWERRYGKAKDQPETLSFEEWNKRYEKKAAPSVPGPKAGPRHPHAIFAQKAVELFPAVGGIVGGALGATGGGIGAVPGAALGGAAGEAMRQNAKRAMGLPAPQSGTEAAKDIGLESALQGGLQYAGGALASGAAKYAPRLAESAQKTMAQALGATKEWAKVEAAKLAPEMLKRGIKGTRTAMLEQAKATASRVGDELNAAYQAAAAAGETVPSKIIRGHLDVASDSLKVSMPGGQRLTIPGTERVHSQLAKLGEFVTSLGDDIPVDKAAHIKRTLDGIVSKAGLFGPKATSSATDAADAWAIREASNAFRGLLNTNPSIAALNKEAAFWMGLRNVLKETQKRTQAQSGGLVQAGMGGAGAVVGALSGDSTSDRVQRGVIGGLLGREGIRLLQSPGFRTSVSAPLKQALADALASGNAETILLALARISAATPGLMRAAGTTRQPEQTGNQR